MTTTLDRTDHTNSTATAQAGSFSTMPRLTSETKLHDSDLLTLEIPDEQLAEFVDNRIKESESFYATQKNLYARQASNLTFYLGTYLRDEDEALKDFQSDFGDNAIYEGEASIKPIALSRLPDIEVLPAKLTDESKKLADNLTKVINTEIRQRQIRKVLGLAFKHMPIYFTGVIKYKWDPDIGKNGDYIFSVVHPNNITLDHTSPDNTVENMNYIAEQQPMSVNRALAKFPKKKKELLEAVGIDPDDPNDAKLASQITIRETWFEYFTTDGEMVNGVCWKYQDVILDKMKNPNFDHEGEEQVDMEENEIRELLVRSRVTGQQPELNTSLVFNNFFKKPQFPYILLGYDQLGEMPYDETSRIEQVKRLQKGLDTDGRQVSDMIRKARGKWIFGEDSGWTAEQLEEADMSDPNTDLIVKGDASKSVAFIAGDQPDQALFRDKETSKQAIFQKMGVNATTRGIVETDTATSAQIARESDFGGIDDMVEDTINAAAEEMAAAIMQMIKLRYTVSHLKRRLGTEAEETLAAIDQDAVEDGMEVIVGSSASDKAERKRQALDLASAKLIDPLTFYEDMELSDPKGRTEKLMKFTTDPEGYMAEFVLDLPDAQAQADALNAQGPPGAAQIAPPVAPPVQEAVTSIV